jgi:hypothetical protein
MPGNGMVNLRLNVRPDEAARIRGLFAMNMWGYPHCDMTFQEACLRDDPSDVTVSPPERRAVALLRQLCDPERVGRYLATGTLYARGNVTGTVFCLVRVTPKVLELDHRGKVVATWCIHANKRGWNPASYGGGSSVPITDEVIVLKNLIEGEEAMFRLTGNRTIYRPVLTARQIPGAFAGRFPGDGPVAAPYIDFGHDDYVKKAQTPDYKMRGVCDPYNVDFMGGMNPQMDPKIVALAKQKYAERQARPYMTEPFLPDMGYGDYIRDFNDDLIHPDDDPNLFEALPGMIQEPVYASNGLPIRGMDQVGTRNLTKLDAKATALCDPQHMFKPFDRAVYDDERWEQQVEAAKKRVEVSIL